MAILVQKLLGEKKLSKPFSAILRLKKKKKEEVPMAIKLEGGGVKALMARPLVEELFFAASLSSHFFCEVLFTLKIIRITIFLFHLKNRI